MPHLADPEKMVSLHSIYEAMRRVFLILLVGAFFVVPAFVFAEEQSPLVPCDGIPSKDGKIPACQACHVVELGQNIINFLVITASSIAVIIFAYAGFLMLTAAGDIGKISEGRRHFTNVAIGMVITLAGWLVIDTVMKWAFQGNTPDGGSELYKEFAPKFGPWNQINCVTLPPYSATAPVNDTPGAGSPASSVSGGPKGLKGSVQCHTDNPACSVESLQAAGFTPAQANAMSCIAMTESSGIPSSVNSGGGACGTFQILPSNWRNANLHQGNCSVASSCTNAECNAQSAYLLFKGNKKSYGDWVCPNYNRWAQRCVDTYDPKPTTTI